MKVTNSYLEERDAGEGVEAVAAYKTGNMADRGQERDQ